MRHSRIAFQVPIRIGPGDLNYRLSARDTQDISNMSEAFGPRGASNSGGEAAFLFLSKTFRIGISMVFSLGRQNIALQAPTWLMLGCGKVRIGYQNPGFLQDPYSSHATSFLHIRHRRSLFHQSKHFDFSVMVSERYSCCLVRFGKLWQTTTP